MTKIQKANTDFYNKVVELLKQARNSVVRTINKTMVYTYFEIGKIIVEEEQKGKSRAEYGAKLLKELSKQLSKEFGKGFSVTNLKQMRQFYLTYEKGQTLSDGFNLSWSHYLMLMRIDTIEERSFYEKESIVNYDRFVKLPEKNKTIGIILCKDKNDALVEITLPENNEQIFASKYLTALPSKEELKKLIENKDDE